MNHVYTAGEIWDGCGSGARRGVTGSAAEAVVGGGGGGGRREEEEASSRISRRTATNSPQDRPVHPVPPPRGHSTQQQTDREGRFRDISFPAGISFVKPDEGHNDKLNSHTTGEIIQPARGRGTKPGGGGAGVRGAGGRGGGVSLGVRACPILRIATPTRKAW